MGAPPSSSAPYAGGLTMWPTRPTPLASPRHTRQCTRSADYRRPQGRSGQESQSPRSARTAVARAPLRGPDSAPCTSRPQRVKMLPEPPACQFDGCERSVKARGLCSAHYQQWRSGKALTPTKYRSPERRTTRRPEPICALATCDRPAGWRRGAARGLCRQHYIESLNADESRRRCSAEDCPRAVRSSGLCRGHYEHARARDESRPRCERKECSRAAIWGGGCHTHATWERRRSKFETLSAEVESWGYISDIPLEAVIRWHQPLNAKDARLRRGDDAA